MSPEPARLRLHAKTAATSIPSTGPLSEEGTPVASPRTNPRPTGDMLVALFLKIPRPPFWGSEALPLGAGLSPSAGSPPFPAGVPEGPCPLPESRPDRRSSLSTSLWSNSVRSGRPSLQVSRDAERLLIERPPPDCPPACPPKALPARPEVGAFPPAAAAGFSTLVPTHSSPQPWLSTILSFRSAKEAPRTASLLSSPKGRRPSKNGCSTCPKYSGNSAPL